MKKKPLLPDVNVWVALSFRTHTQHAPADAWFSGLAPNDTLHFCRTTQQGFLRLATNKKILPKEAVTLSDAWKLYDSILTDPRISYLGEPSGIDAQWRNYTQGNAFSTNVWTDAYLAAFARVADYEVVTFDNGFTRYPGLTWTLLK